MKYSIFVPTKMSDWYKVNRAEVERRGGKGLFHHYHTFEELIRDTYPHYNWDSSMFFSGPKKHPGYWSESKVTLALDKAEQLLGITQVFPHTTQYNATQRNTAQHMYAG